MTATNSPTGAGRERRNRKDEDVGTHLEMEKEHANFK